MVMLMLQMWMLQAKMKLNEFCRKENGDVNVVSIVVLIGVAVLLAIVFKDFVGNLLKDMLNSIGGKANGVVTNEIGG